MGDLMGADLPVADVEGADAGGGDGNDGAAFAWCDGAFLRALRRGEWVLLDELNLAPPAVLEGLNACLDHRGEAFVPELGRRFAAAPGFRVFATQNPRAAGGGRKGLPRSLLGRFTKVCVSALNDEDLLAIATAKFPQLISAGTSADGGPVADDALLESSRLESSPLAAVPPILRSRLTPAAPRPLLMLMIAFNGQVSRDTTGNDVRYGRVGAPFEFNLRDVFRWAELLAVERPVADFTTISSGLGSSSYSVSLQQSIAALVDMLYVQRMRTLADRAAVASRFRQIFTFGSHEDTGTRRPARAQATDDDLAPIAQVLEISDRHVQLGAVVLPRWFDGFDDSSVGTCEVSAARAPMALPAGLGRAAEAVARCVRMRCVRQTSSSFYA